MALLGIIAHNVKGPVKYMQFITDYTLRNWEKMQPNDLLDCATVINESARNISDHLGDLLNWARIQNDTFNPEHISFSVGKALEQEIKVQRPFMRLKQVTLKTDIPKDLFLESDEHLLKLAFHNILTNAVKFTKKSGEIHLSAYKTKEGTYIVTKDNGIGMSDAELESLENERSFSKLGTANEQGSGFGMLITHQLVELMNGTLKIESEPNLGTLVQIFVPH